MTDDNSQTILRPSTHFLAIVSLVLSILGLLPVLPLVGSIAGLVTGLMARKEIRSRPDLYTGEGPAKAGIVLGWIGLGGIVLICVAFLLLAVVSRSTTGITVGTSIPQIITMQPIPIQP